MENPDAFLKRAVEQIVSHINHDKLDPQSAAIKVAQDLQLNPNFIKRASEAINVALTYQHMKTANDKASDFPIVDATKVVNAVYGQTEKQAGEYKSEQFSSHQSAETPPNFDRYLNDERYKAAYESILSTEAPDRNQLSTQGVYEKTAHYIRNLKRAADEAVSKKAGAEWDARQAFCDILHQFSKVAEYRGSWVEFESQVFAKHGEAANAYLDLLYKVAGQGEPRGVHDSKSSVFTQTKEAALYDTFIAKTAELSEVTKEADDATYNYQFEQGNLYNIFREHRENIEKEGGSANTLIELNSLAHLTKKRVAAKEDEADPVLKAAQDKINAALDIEEGAIKEAFSIMDTAMGKFNDEGKPNQDIHTNNEEDNRQRKLVLQDLAVTDPILKKVDRNKLVASYSQMMRIAPELAGEKEIVRSTLRSMTASQALGPFEGQQLIQANNEMLKQRQLMQGKPPQLGGK